MASAAAVGAVDPKLVFLFDEFECVTKNERLRPDFYSFLRVGLLGKEEALTLNSCVRDGRAGPDAPGAAPLEKKGYLAREGDTLVPFSGEFARFLSGHLDRLK